MPTLTHEGLDIHWREWGQPTGTPVVLIHGLFLSTRMYDRLAGYLDDRWIIAIDLRGHGLSSRPAEGWRYSWDSMAGDVEAVLDKLGVERAVVGGLSLGANVGLAFGLSRPERTAGMIIEMPVLSTSETASRVVFGLFGVVLRAGAGPIGALGGVVQRLPIPKEPSELRMFADAAVFRPASAAAVIDGLMAAPIPAHDHAALASIGAPALVIGHDLDPIHAVADARQLAADLPNARLMEVSTIYELRFRPWKLAEAIHQFLRANDL